jgi:hypothetical protein
MSIACRCPVRAGRGLSFGPPALHLPPTLRLRSVLVGGKTEAGLTVELYLETYSGRLSPPLSQFLLSLFFYHF